MPIRASMPATALADRLVVDVAVVRAVDPDVETVGIARLGQQLLRRRRVIGISLVERLVVAVDARRRHGPTGGDGRA